MSKQNSRRSFWQSIRQGLGFYRNPPYVEAKLRDDDVQSAKYLAIVVIFVEIYMLIRYIVKYGAMCETFGEFLHYTYSYWILLLVSALICLYAKFYLNGGMKRLGTYSRLLVFLFYATGIYFGAKTAMSDFSRGRMITCFLTMLMYGTIILVIRPYLSILLTVFTAGSFLYLLNNYSFNKAGEQVVMNSGDTINYVTFLIILGVLEISVYYQRYRDACKAQELEKAAVTDSLTGIPNQMKFETDATAYAAESIRMGRKPVYLCFDVHNFQTFNDQSGYDGGDELLRRLGRAVEAAFPGEPVARQSGDLFCALSCAADALARAERV